MFLDKIIAVMRGKHLYLVGILSILLSQKSIPFTGENLNITIYNQGKAFIQESRLSDFSNTGNQTFSFTEIPEVVIPSSINVRCKDCFISSKIYLNNPINQKTLINAFIGKHVTLVQYNESGKKSVNKSALVISNNGVPVFEIDGEILVDPPFEIIFPFLPEYFNQNNALDCSGTIHKKEVEFDLDYLISGLDWNANYTLNISGRDSVILSAWYSINNTLHFDYLNAFVSLVSGDVQFTNTRKPVHFQKRVMESDSRNYSEPNVSSTEDYAVFHIPGKINLPGNSISQHIFIVEKEMPIQRKYNIEHSINRYYGSRSKKTSVPVSVTSTIEFNSSEIGDFNLPDGLIRAYEFNEDHHTFIGENNIPLTQVGELVSIEIGKTADITAQFTLVSTEIDRKSTMHSLDAVLKNVRNHSVSVIWNETFSGDWKITKSSFNYEKIDSQTAQFIVEIPAHQKKDISFTVRIDRN